MQSQIFPWKRTNVETKKEETSELQGALRPIELWEYCVPEDAIPEVMFYLGMKGDGKQVHDDIFGMKKFAWLFRKGLKLLPLPKYDENKLIIRKRLIYKEALSIYGLGWRKDLIKEFPWGYIQEGV